MEQTTLSVLLVTPPLWSCCLPLCYLLYPITGHPWRRWQLVRTRFLSVTCRTLSFPKKKERYPAYIKRSKRRYRGIRSRTLSALIGKNLGTLREHRQLSLEQAAAGMGISADMLHLLESGELEITPSLLIAASDYFSVLIDCMVYQDLSIEQ